MKTKWRALDTFALVLLSLLLAIGLAGCRSEQPAATPSLPEPATSDEIGAMAPAELVGTSWKLESLGGGNDQVQANENVLTTLGFFADRYGGNSGCNFYVGVFEADNSLLTFETPARTGDTCEESPESLTQESVFMSALATVASYALDGQKLEMFSSAEQLMLTMTPIEPVPLDGTLWELQFVNVETQWNAILPDTEITLQIDGDQLSGLAGCNGYSASVSESAGALTVSELAVTEKACMEPAGVMEQESLYVSMLADVALVRQFPVSLQLLDVDGRPLLLYEAQDGQGQ
jgi:heat shock protein HslJ